jgi:hypothetical protein
MFGAYPPSKLGMFQPCLKYLTIVEVTDRDYSNYSYCNKELITNAKSVKVNKPFHNTSFIVS